MNKQFRGPLFIIGMPRSGTKLLRDLLNQHSQIFIPDIETEFLIYWFNNWNRFGDLSDRMRFINFYNEVLKAPYFLYQRERNTLTSCEEWFEACEQFDVASVFKALVRLDTGTDSTVIWGDKSPSYTKDIALIKEIYPEARFVHITRDVRDYVLSINKAWGKNILRAANRWGTDVFSAHNQIKLLGSDGLELKYEDLITDVQSSLENICIFLGVDYEESMAELKHETENLGDAKGFVGIVCDNKQKYIFKLKGARLRRVESAAYNSMLLLGYEPDLATRQVEIPKVVLGYYRILDGINLIKSKARERGLIGSFLFHFNHYRITSKS